MRPHVDCDPQLRKTGEGGYVHHRLIHHFLAFSLILPGELTNCQNCVKSLSGRLNPFCLGLFPSPSMSVLGKFSFFDLIASTVSQIKRHRFLFKMSLFLLSQLHFPTFCFSTLMLGRYVWVSKSYNKQTGTKVRTHSVSARQPQVRTTFNIVLAFGCL